MNGKLARQIRREAKKRISEEILFLNRALKPKPKRFPVFLWKLFARLYFKEGYFDFR